MRVTPQVENYFLPAATKRVGREIFNVCAVIDMSGAKLTTLLSKQSRQHISNFIGTQSDFFPECLGQMLIVNAPSILATAWNIFSSLLDSRTKSKIQIAPPGLKTRCLLQKFIHPSQLPTFLHGTVQTPLDRLLPIIDNQQSRAAMAKAVASDLCLQTWRGNWAVIHPRNSDISPTAMQPNMVEPTVMGQNSQTNEANGAAEHAQKSARMKDPLNENEEKVVAATLSRAKVFFEQVADIRQRWATSLPDGALIAAGSLGRTRISRAEAVALFSTVVEPSALSALLLNPSDADRDVVKCANADDAVIHKNGGGQPAELPIEWSKEDGKAYWADVEQWWTTDGLRAETAAPPTSVTGPVGVKIVGSTRCPASRSGSTYAYDLYAVRVWPLENPAAGWKVDRRYSDFVLLRDKLMNLKEDLATAATRWSDLHALDLVDELPPFPEKRWLRSTSLKAETVNDRLALLDPWLAVRKYRRVIRSRRVECHCSVV